jgi:hypothetical protein
LVITSHIALVDVNLVMPKAADRNFGHFGNVSIPSPSSAYRMTLNTGRSAFFGEKYNHYKVNMPWLCVKQNRSSTKIRFSRTTGPWLQV